MCDCMYGCSSVYTEGSECMHGYIMKLSNIGVRSQISAMGALRQSSSFSYLWHLYLRPKLGGVPKMQGEPKNATQLIAIRFSL